MLKKSLLLITLSFILSTDLPFVVLVANALPSNTVETQKAIPKNLTKKSKRKRGITFKVPGVRISRNLEPGAARGKCSPKEISAILSPPSKSQKPGTIPVEKTLSDRPTFFVYVPETSAKQASFLLTNDQGDVVLEKTLDVTSESGIVYYTLPDDFQGLEINQNYLWRLSLLCDNDDRSGDPQTSGWITRVEPTKKIAQDLQLAKEDLDRIDVYAKNGYWQDSLKGLVDLQTANPQDQDLTTNWSSFLQSAGLNYLDKQSIIQLFPSESTNK